MTGIINFESEQEKVDIILEGAYIGQTPLEVKGAEAGRYVFGLSHEEYEDFSSFLDVYDGKITQVYVDLESRSENIDYEDIKPVITTETETPLTGVIRFRSTQENVDITLEGEYAGKTPLDIKNTEIGRYTFTMSLEGYEDFISELYVYEETITNVSIDLESRHEDRSYEDILKTEITDTGAIQFISTQDNVDIILEGGYAGKTPLDIKNTKVGKYTFTMSLEGYDDFTSELYVYKDKVTKVSVDLELHHEDREYIDITTATAEEPAEEEAKGEPAPEEISIEQHLADMNQILSKNNEILDQLSQTMEVIRQYIETSSGFNTDMSYFNTDELAISVATPNRPSSFDVIANATTTPPSPGYDRIIINQVLGRNSPHISVVNDGSTNLYAVLTHDGSSYSSSESKILRGEIKHFYNVYELRIRGPVVGNLDTTAPQEPGGVYRVTEYPSQLDFNNLNKPAIFVNAADVGSIPALTAVTFTIIGDIINLTSTFRASVINTDYVFYTYQGGSIFNPAQRGILAPGDVMRVNGTRGMQVTFSGNSAGQIVELTTETDLSI